MQEIMSKPDYLLWCDLETTGLDPEKDDILEIALVLTTPELVVEDSKHYIITPPNISLPEISNNVIAMHTKNGLWLDVINKGVELYKANDLIFVWLDGIIPYPEKTPERQYPSRDWSKVYLAGSSVHFDRQFLKNKKLRFEDTISHRHVDVSVVRTLLKMWNPELLWKQNDTHRALDDIYDHIAELKHYRNILRLDTIGHVNYT